jgi:hypothetical protein
MENKIYKPLYFLRRLFSISFILVFLACATSEKSVTVGEKQVTGETSGAETGIIVFTNKTPFTVRLVRGSGRVEVAALAPGASQIVSNTFEAAEDYFPLYDIPLTASYSLERLRPGDINFYYRIDKNITRQEIEIHLPANITDSSSALMPAYISFTHNNSRTGGVSVSRNVSRNEMTGINFSESKSNINKGETFIFRENPRDLQNLRINPLNITFGEMTYKPGHVYSFVYEDTGVSLTDVRPLHRVGEAGWTKTVDNAQGTMPLTAADGEIYLFAPETRNLVRSTFDSAGNEKAPLVNGESFDITFADRGRDGFFTGGYENDGNNVKPIARVLGADGQTRRILEPSKRREYWQAYFLTAAQKDNSTWLAAGGAAADAAFGFTAYARLVQDNGTVLSAQWELGGGDFNAKRGANSGAECGKIRSAMYDAKNNRWIVTGENLEFDSFLNPVIGSYIAVINSAGVVQKTDVSFKGVQFYKLLPDSNGNFYAAGEEIKGGETYALLVKYNAEGRELWRLSTQPPSNSYYQDAILDAENGQIVLAGTLKARTSSGSGGTPFIEGVDYEKGTLLWREELTNSAFAGTALVTAVVPAPDYGFALALTGVANDNYSKPFKIARVNARGKLIK